MPKLHVVLEEREHGCDRAVALETPTIELALVVARISSVSGETEIWDGTQRLARLRRLGLASGLNAGSPQAQHRPGSVQADFDEAEESVSRIEPKPIQPSLALQLSVTTIN